MRRQNRPDIRASIGLPPGSLVYTGRAEKDTVRVTRFVYDGDHMIEETVDDPQRLRVPSGRDGVTWVNIDGLSDTGLLSHIAEEFSIHPLVMEDILNTGQRPKVEAHGELLFVTLKMLSVRSASPLDVEPEHVSVVLGKRFVLSFQERRGDTFDPVRDRIRTGVGRIRTSGADYLAYALIDSIVDYYFLLLETISDEIERLEERVFEHPDEKTVREVHRLKREIIDIRRAVWPMREVVGGLERNESGLIMKTTRPFLRDLYDHIIQVADTVESFRDAATGLVDLYMSAASNRMNEVMKVLTIIATIFIPLTFVAGIYGMNFDPSAGPLSMPELAHPLGYLITLGVMLLIAVGMVIYFKRKKWL